jgi:hypothetical protein
MGIRIRIQHFSNCGSGFRIPDPGFDDLKLKKNYSWKFNFYFLDQKLPFTYPLASIRDFQATGEAFSPQKTTFSTSKHENSVLFSFLWVLFALLDPDPQFECGSRSSNSNACGSGYGSGS